MRKHLPFESLVQTLSAFVRLEWESAVLRGASTFQSLEEERLNNLKSVLTSYLHHSSELNPRLIEVGLKHNIINSIL